MNMTKKDYALLANAIAEGVHNGNVVRVLCLQLHQQNNKFSAAKFKRAVYKKLASLGYWLPR